jgi:hypothetical protein
MEVLANNVRLFPKGERKRDDGAGVTAPAEEVTDLEPF